MVERVARIDTGQLADPPATPPELRQQAMGDDPCATLH
jgi:hypothetical protein